MINQSQLLDQQFLEARGKLLEVAAFLDRFERAPADSPDFRLTALKEAFKLVAAHDSPNRARFLLELLSDKSSQPLEKSTNTPACGAPINL